MLFPNAGIEVNPALLLLLGLMVGTLSGFFGVGGGFLITGGLLVFGIPPLYAVGTGFALIMGSSVVNTLKHRRMGNVDYKLGILMLVGTLPALVAAQRLNSHLEGAGLAGPVLRYLYMVSLASLAAFIIYDFWKVRSSKSQSDDAPSTAALTLRLQSLRIPPAAVPLPGGRSLSTTIAFPRSGIAGLSVWIPLGTGALIGFVAGLLGAGGGFVLMPVLVFVFGLPTAVAVGTALFQVLVTGSMGSLLYSLAGRVDIIMVVMMLGTASLGSQIGVAGTRYVDGTRIRLLYGLTLLFASFSVALKQVSESISSLDYLSDVASMLLLGAAGAMCLIIGVFLIGAAASSRGTTLAVTHTEKKEGPDEHIRPL